MEKLERYRTYIKQLLTGYACFVELRNIHR